MLIPAQHCFIITWNRCYSRSKIWRLQKLLTSSGRQAEGLLRGVQHRGERLSPLLLPRRPLVPGSSADQALLSLQLETAASPLQHPKRWDRKLIDENTPQCCKTKMERSREKMRFPGLFQKLREISCRIPVGFKNLGTNVDAITFSFLRGCLSLLGGVCANKVISTTDKSNCERFSIPHGADFSSAAQCGSWSN